MSTPCWNCGSDLRVCVDCDLYNGKYIEIPDNTTNGDMIRALFKPNRVEKIDDDIIVENYDFSKKWWNSPYQKGK